MTKDILLNTVGGRRACTQDEEPFLGIVYTSLRNRLSAYANVR